MIAEPKRSKDLDIQSPDTDENVVDIEAKVDLILKQIEEGLPEQSDESQPVAKSDNEFTDKSLTDKSDESGPSRQVAVSRVHPLLTSTGSGPDAADKVAS